MQTPAADPPRVVAVLSLLDSLPDPAPQTVLTARLAAGHTQAAAAALVGLSGAHKWSQYERGERTPDVARWALYLLATDQHPLMRSPRRRGKDQPEREASGNQSTVEKQG